MPPEPSVTSASVRPIWCTLRYSSALLPKSFERPGPKSVSPATYCSGVEVVVPWRWIVDIRPPYLADVEPFRVLETNHPRCRILIPEVFRRQFLCPVGDAYNTLALMLTKLPKSAQSDVPV